MVDTYPRAGCKLLVAVASRIPNAWQIPAQDRHRGKRNYVQSPGPHGAYHRRYSPLSVAPLNATAPGKNMCLAVPMQIKSIDEFKALCEARGVDREVSLFMLQGEDISVGDFVLVHVGYAIQKISSDDADASWQLFDELLEGNA